MLVAVPTSLALLVALHATPVLAAGSLATKPTRLAYFGTDARLRRQQRTVEAPPGRTGLRGVGQLVAEAEGISVPRIAVVDVRQAITTRGWAFRSMEHDVKSLPRHWHTKECSNDTLRSVVDESVYRR